jgi:hypothetical protein
MKNKIYSFWGATALNKAEKFIECAKDLGITLDRIDMMQDNQGDDDTLMVAIAIFTSMSNLLKLDNFELFLDNKIF